MVMTITGAGRQGFSQRHDTDLKKRRPRQQAEAAPATEDFVRRERPLTEQTRAEIAAVYRAISDAEDALALVAAADSGLARSEDVVQEMEAGLEAAAGGNIPPGAESAAPEAVSAWVAGLLDHLEHNATGTQFGGRHLLDGSLGCAGLALGDGLTFVSATDATRSSPAEGYEVMLTREPARTTLLGQVPLTLPLIEGDGGGGALRLELGCEGKRTGITSRAGQTPEDVAAALGLAAKGRGLPLHVDITSEGRLLVQHSHFGSAYRFEAFSSVPGVLSETDGAPALVANGMDIAGTINEERALGEGQTLTGMIGNPNTDGLTVRYTGLPYTGGTRRLPRSRPSVLEARVFAGRIIIVRQAIAFRFDHRQGGTVFLGLDSVRPGGLGRGLGERYESLDAIRVVDHEGLPEAIALARCAANELARHRRRLGELTRERLRPILEGLRAEAQAHMAAGQARHAGRQAQNTLSDALTLPANSRSEAARRLEVSINRDATHTELDQVRNLSRWIRDASGVALNAHARPSQKTLMGLLHGEDEAQPRRHPVIEVRG